MNRKQNILLAVIILVLFSMLLLIVFGDNELADLYILKEERDSLIEKNEMLARKNMKLYREINRLKNDPEYIEDVVRRELGVIGKNEVIFKPGAASADQSGNHNKK